MRTPGTRAAPALLILALSAAPLAAQAAPPAPRISLVTILPGKDLYSSFGHTAIRVIDPATGRDRLYNYGLSANPFDLRFALGMLAGRMDFMVAAERTAPVLEYYREVENRGLVEQVFALDEARARSLAATLETGARRENRVYNYRYFADNCATRPAAILRAAVGDASPPFAGRPAKTLRSSVEEVLAPRPWLGLGIGLLLGPATDRPIPEGPIFLPGDLMAWAAGASFEGPSGRAPLVSRTETLFVPRPEARPRWAISPPLAFALLLALALLASVLPEALRAARGAFDAALFAAVVAPWLAILLFWLSAGYAEVGWNLNLLWAGPLPLAALALGRGGRRSPAALLLFRIAAIAALAFAAGGGFGMQSVPAEARLAAAAVALRCALREGVPPRPLLSLPFMRRYR